MIRENAYEDLFELYAEKRAIIATNDFYGAKWIEVLTDVEWSILRVLQLETMYCL